MMLVKILFLIFAVGVFGAAWELAVYQKLLSGEKDLIEEAIQTLSTKGNNKICKVLDEFFRRDKDRKDTHLGKVHSPIFDAYVKAKCDIGNILLPYIEFSHETRQFSQVMDIFEKYPKAKEIRGRSLCVAYGDAWDSKWDPDTNDETFFIHHLKVMRKVCYTCCNDCEEDGLTYFFGKWYDMNAHIINFQQSLNQVIGDLEKSPNRRLSFFYALKSHFSGEPLEAIQHLDSYDSQSNDYSRAVTRKAKSKILAASFSALFGQVKFDSLQSKSLANRFLGSSLVEHTSRCCVPHQVQNAISVGLAHAIHFPDLIQKVKSLTVEDYFWFGVARVLRADKNISSTASSYLLSVNPSLVIQSNAEEKSMYPKFQFFGTGSLADRIERHIKRVKEINRSHAFGLDLLINVQYQIRPRDPSPELSAFLDEGFSTVDLFTRNREKAVRALSTLPLIRSCGQCSNMMNLMLTLNSYASDVQPAEQFFVIWSQMDPSDFKKVGEVTEKFFRCINAELVKDDSQVNTEKLLKDYEYASELFPFESAWRIATLMDVESEPLKALQYAHSAFFYFKKRQIHPVASTLIQVISKVKTSKDPSVTLDASVSAKFSSLCKSIDDYVLQIEDKTSEDAQDLLLEYATFVEDTPLKILRAMNGMQTKSKMNQVSYIVALVRAGQTKEEKLLEALNEIRDHGSGVFIIILRLSIKSTLNDKVPRSVLRFFTKYAMENLSKLKKFKKLLSAVDPTLIEEVSSTSPTTESNALKDHEELPQYVELVPKAGKNRKGKKIIENKAPIVSAPAVKVETLAEKYQISIAIIALASLKDTDSLKHIKGLFQTESNGRTMKGFSENLFRLRWKKQRILFTIQNAELRILDIINRSTDYSRVDEKVLFARTGFVTLDDAIEMN